VRLDQLLMGSKFDTLAVFQDNDLISILDGRKSMGDDQSSPALHESVECVLDEVLRLVIE